jgi:epoxyqueuosine reductase
MSNAHDDNAKRAIFTIADTYGIEVVGFLKLDGETTIPDGEMKLLRGVKWADIEVKTSEIKDPLEIMPGAKTMIILGKRLLDDTQDIYYRLSKDYMASIEMMALDIAVLKAMGELKKTGVESEEYTSYYMKVWAVLAGLGWIGRSRMFVSKDHGPRLRLRGILTDADLGEPFEILGDEHCGDCMECMKACPVGAISGTEVDRKKCGASPLNHRRISEKAYSYCTACTASCPVGMDPTFKLVPGEQAQTRQRITP